MLHLAFPAFIRRVWTFLNGMEPAILAISFQGPESRLATRTNQMSFTATFYDAG